MTFSNAVKLAIIIGGSILSIYLFSTPHTPSPPSPAVAAYRTVCQDFILEEMGEPGQSARAVRDWRKNGNRVFMIEITGPGEDETHLCVVDPDEGLVWKPSALSYGEWMP